MSVSPRKIKISMYLLTKLSFQLTQQFNKEGLKFILAFPVLCMHPFKTRLQDGSVFSFEHLINGYMRDTKKL